MNTARARILTECGHEEMIGLRFRVDIIPHFCVGFWDREWEITSRAPKPLTLPLPFGKVQTKANRFRMIYFASPVGEPRVSRAIGFEAVVKKGKRDYSKVRLPAKFRFHKPRNDETP